jgi:iron complex transport system substrate-binding protein
LRAAFITSTRHSSLPANAQPGALALRLAFVLVMMALVIGCHTKREPAANGREFTDEIGRRVRVPDHPARIVSLAPSVTETLFALGLGERIVGVTTYCNYPPEAAQKEKIGDTQRPSIEKIVALKADLVIASTASQLEQFVRSLEQIGIPIYVSNPRNLDGVLESINHIGDLTGVPSRAQELRAKLTERIAKITSQVNNAGRPRVLFLIGSEPLITVGGNTFVNDLITRAGGQSISADQQADYPQFSLETAIARQPEIIFFQVGGENLPNRLKGTPAARAGRVAHIDDDLLLRPGPRVVDGFEQMAAQIHPEIMRDN